jgi:hypothetical protein
MVILVKNLTSKQLYGKSDYPKYKSKHKVVQPISI